MARKIYKYFFYFTVSLFFFFLTYITFNSNFRTTAIHYLINSYKVYMIVSVQPYLKRNNPDFSSAKKKIIGIY